MLKRWNFLKTGFYEGINDSLLGQREKCVFVSTITHKLLFEAQQGSGRYYIPMLRQIAKPWDAGRLVGGVLVGGGGGSPRTSHSCQYAIV